MNLCTACGGDFVGVRDFDSHRVGRFPQTGPVDYRDRPAARLEDWRPELGRRCLDVEELEVAGWQLDRFGRWAHPRRDRAGSRHSSVRSAA